MRMLITPFAVLALSTGALAQTATPPAEEQRGRAISRDHAEQIALRHVPGQVEEVTEDTWNGGVAWTVTVQSEDGEDYEVVIDADNGRIVEVDS